MVFDVFKVNLDGSLSGHIVGASFQHSFLAVEGTTASVVPGGVVSPGDVIDPEWFITDEGGTCGLHLAIARVYLGSTAIGEPFTTGEAMTVMCS